MIEHRERLAVRPAKAAEIADVARSTVYAEMASGRLAFVVVGKSKRILVSDLETWLRRNRQAAADERPEDAA